MDRGDWMVTVSGRRQYVGAPDVDNIVIEDIAHALAKYTRFGGHTLGDGLYSVAQHSVLVSRIFETEAQAFLRHAPSRNLVLGALLHDAAEAYLGDLIRPVKTAAGADYRVFETEWEIAIERRFGASFYHSNIVKHCDLIALATERRDLLPFADPKLNPEAWRWKEDELAVEPWPEKIVPWSIRESRERFLARFDELTNAREA
jgi:uncharacterized protein